MHIEQVATAHGELSGVTANQHHAQLHGSAHVDGGADAVNFPLGHKRIKKSADQTVISSTTMVNDADFTFAVNAGEVWAIEMILDVRYTNTDTFKWTWNGTATFTGKWVAFAPAAPSESEGTVKGTAIQQGAAGLVQTLRIWGEINVTVSGTWALQWAQFFSAAINTQVLTQSVLVAHRIS